MGYNPNVPTLCSHGISGVFSDGDSEGDEQKPHQ